MKNEEKNVITPPIVDDGDPYIIVVSSGGPPTEGEEDDFPGNAKSKLKFPFGLVSLGANASDILAIANFIDSSGTSYYEEVSDPLSLSDKPTQVKFTIDYNKIPRDRVILIQLSWSEVNHNNKSLLLTVPFSYPESKKEYLKKVNLTYQKKPV